MHRRALFGKLAALAAVVAAAPVVGTRVTEAMLADAVAEAYNRGHAVATSRAQARVALGLPL